MIYFALACIVFFLVLCTGAVVEFIRDKVKRLLKRQGKELCCREEEPEQDLCREKT